MITHDQLVCILVLNKCKHRSLKIILKDKMNARRPDALCLCLSPRNDAFESYETKLVLKKITNAILIQMFSQANRLVCGVIVHFPLAVLFTGQAFVLILPLMNESQTGHIFHIH